MYDYAYVLRLKAVRVNIWLPENSPRRICYSNCLSGPPRKKVSGRCEPTIGSNLPMAPIIFVFPIGKRGKCVHGQILASFFLLLQKLCARVFLCFFAFCRFACTNSVSPDASPLSLLSLSLACCFRYTSILPRLHLNVRQPRC